MGRLLFMEPLGQPADDRTDLLDGLSAFVGVIQQCLDFRAVGRIELAEHVSGQPGVVRVKGHGRTSWERALAAWPSNR